MEVDGKRIFRKLRFYLRLYYDPFRSFSESYSLGAFRGYVHALGDCGLIPRTTEVHLCALDLDERKYPQAVFNVRTLLEDGFSSMLSGKNYENEDILKFCLGEENA